MYFIDFYTKMSVYNSSINTGVTFTKLFQLGFQTALQRIISNWTSVFVCPATRFLTEPHGNKNLSEVYRGSELMTPALFSLIYIVMERSL